MRSPLVVSALCVAAAQMAGCSDTAVLLEVTSDRAKPAALDAICLSVASDGAQRFARRVALAGAPLPQSLTVFGDGARVGTAHALGLRAGQIAAEIARPVTFQKGKVLRETLAVNRCPPLPAGSLTFELADARTASPGARGILLHAPGGVEALILDGGASARYDASLTAGAKLASLPPPPPVQATALVAADFDGDCTTDLVALGAGDPLLLRSAPSGAPIVDGSAIPSGGAAAGASGDLDGDGNPDLVLCSGPTLRVLLGAAGGRRFSSQASAISEPASDRVTDATACALADFDGDGHLDLVVGQGSTTPAIARLYLNDAMGTGHLTFVKGALPQLAERTTALAAGDLDGDGAIDLVVAHAGGPIRLYRNRGDATLEDRSFGNLPDAVSATVPSLLLADLDGDCALDLVVPRAGEVPKVWRGDGQGGFTQADSLPMPGRGDAAGAAALDVDGDGLTDLLLVGGAQGVALFRQRR